ncbi:T9SS type A sorting domain-containing protein, partial [Dyadobacter psychrophilus]
TNCPGGPTIATIKNISSTGLTVDFNGSGVSALTWRIKQGGSTLANGKTGTLSSNSATLTFASLAAGTYSLEIEGGNCTSLVSTSNFNVVITDSRPTCQFGPLLKSIIDPKATQLTFNFHGENVASIDWKILQGATTIRSARVQLASDRPTITYGALAPGSYTLAIEGGACRSEVQTMGFQIGGLLPVPVARFEAVPATEGVELAWTAQEQKEGSGFEVIRYNGNLKTSAVIGNIPSSDQQVGEYRFVDRTPLFGVNHYQLNVIDKNGTYSKSEIVNARYEVIDKVIVSPNPVKDFVNIEFYSKIAGQGKLETFNISGVKVNAVQPKITEGLNKVSLNVTGLADGHYFIKVYYGVQEMNLRFFKSN